MSTTEAGPELLHNGTGSTIPVENPATGQTIAELPSLDRDATLELVRRAGEAQPKWEALGFRGRGDLMRDMRRWLIRTRSATPSRMGAGRRAWTGSAW